MRYERVCGNKASSALARPPQIGWDQVLNESNMYRIDSEPKEERKMDNYYDCDLLSYEFDNWKKWLEGSMHLSVHVMQLTLFEG